MDLGIFSYSPSVDYSEHCVCVVLLWIKLQQPLVEDIACSDVVRIAFDAVTVGSGHVVVTQWSDSTS